MIIKKILVLTCFYMFTNSIFAHGGGVDSNGCHVQKNTGKEHCHGQKKDARDAELADSKERHRKFCRGIPDVPNSAPRFDAYGNPCRGAR